jgi:PEP-CTERM motif.
MNETVQFQSTQTPAAAPATSRLRPAISIAVQVAAASMLFCGQAAFASIILVSPTQFSGTGLGTVPTILTIQDNPTEVGCIGFTGAGSTFNSAGVCGGSAADVKTGASQTQLQPLSAAAGGGITTASDFAFIFNANQPAAGPITLSGVQVAFYNSMGGFLYESSGLDCSASPTGCTFPTTFSGTGNSGFEFQLNSAQQLAATKAGAFSSASNLVGLSASVTGSAGGPETFYLVNANPGGGTISSVPEPSSILLSAAGLLLLLSSAITRRYQSAK